MKIQTFLEHHGISRNPFAQEDAQSDPVFNKTFCIESIHHPTWDKVYGDPSEPSTAILFGEKGAGKTALRLQIDRHLRHYNDHHPQHRVFVIHYDDFNPFLDRFREAVGGWKRRNTRRLLQEWKLWDHMDAILAVGVTQFVNEVLGEQRATADEASSPRPLKPFDRFAARDLLLLTALYDQSTAETKKGRWNRLRAKLNFHTWKAYWQFALGCIWPPLVIITIIVMMVNGMTDSLKPLWLWFVIALAGWLPWLWRTVRTYWLSWKIERHTRTGNHAIGALQQILASFTPTELAAQPFPNRDRTDDRYELLGKFQRLLEQQNYTGIVVLVDRVDEPHLINGTSELMKLLIWPLLDNKFLKHPGMGLKMMLPLELAEYTKRETPEFYQRARLDKQHVVSSFSWSGEALYDVTNARIAACAVEGRHPRLRDLFDATVSDDRLIEAMRSLGVPRRLFKLLHHVLVVHCNAYTDDAPQWKISSHTFETSLAVMLQNAGPDRQVAAI